LILRNSRKKEKPLGEIVHTSRIKIVREKGPTRKAMIDGFVVCYSTGPIERLVAQDVLKLLRFYRSKG